MAFIKAEILPISIEDAQTYTHLPCLAEHRDPFDRILVTQAINRSLILVSSDEKFDRYSIHRVWT